jgi:hypothetical protein
MQTKKYLTEVFRTYYDGSNLIELAHLIEAWAASTTALYERWKRPDRGNMKELKVRNRRYHYEKATENSKFGPEWILHGGRGARYGLFRGVNDEFIPLNLKTRKVVAKAGTFKATEGGLVWSRELSYLDKIITSINETETLVEGGNAAEALLPKLQATTGNGNLKYSKIPQSALGVVFREIVEPVILELAEAGLIDKNYKTEFGLGSTRLAAKIVGYDVKVYKSETPESIAKATMMKKHFGDLDIDVVLTQGTKIADVGKFLESKHPEKYAFKLGNKEINVAAVLDGNSVVQIDIVDVSSEKEDMMFMQSSSIVDISAGVKGAIQKWLIRAVLSVKDITPAHKKLIAQALKKNPEYLKWAKQGYTPNKEGESDRQIGRYSLSTAGGIYLVFDIYKPGVKNKKLIKVQEEPVARFSNLPELINFILPGADEDVANSAVKMAEYVRENFDGADVDKIWNAFVESMANQTGAMDPADYNAGMAKMAEMFGKPWKAGE